MNEPGLGAAPYRAAAEPAAPWGADRPLVHSRARPPLLVESVRPPGRGQEVPKVGGFRVGDRVFHQKFGYGTVRAVEDNRLAIEFEHAGDKKVMDAFVEHA